MTAASAEVCVFANLGQLVADLLESGQVLAGFPAADGRGFQSWELSPMQTIERINSEWDKLGREPNIGDVVWFTARETVPHS